MAFEKAKEYLEGYGLARIDNHKYKERFGCKAKMIPAELVTFPLHPTTTRNRGNNLFPEKCYHSVIKATFGRAGIVDL